MARLLLFIIPALIFIVPARWFRYYAMLLFAIITYVLLVFTLLTEEAGEAFASFGIEATAGYMALVLLLLAVRYGLIRRARARILKLPAPEKK